MSQLILSICIPTYNRVAPLEYLLQNIILQLTENNLLNLVEICISDNASTDNTGPMVAKYKKQYPGIVYSCNSGNIGFDRNLLQSVEIANGQYCWLFGSDDRFEPYAIATIIQYLQQYNDLGGISVNVQNYNPDFSQAIDNPKFRPKVDFYSSSVSEIYKRLGQSFSFISAQIINKKKWDNVIKNDDLSEYYNGYIHVFVIAKIVKDYPKWQYLSQKLVGWRSGNDSALESGVDGYMKRLRLDYAYFDIAAAVFGKRSWIYFYHGNVVCSEFIFGNLQNMKANAKINIYPVFKEVAQRCWMFPMYYIKILPLFLLPRPAVDFIKLLKRSYRNLKR